MLVEKTTPSAGLRMLLLVLLEALRVVVGLLLHPPLILRQLALDTCRQRFVRHRLCVKKNELGHVELLPHPRGHDVLDLAQEHAEEGSLNASAVGLSQLRVPRVIGVALALRGRMGEDLEEGEEVQVLRNGREDGCAVCLREGLEERLDGLVVLVDDGEERGKEAADERQRGSVEAVEELI